MQDAIRENVRPGMGVHFAQTGVRWPAAAIHEIARQFWGARPGFTLIGQYYYLNMERMGKQVKEKAEQLIKDARAALAAGYFEQGYALFKQSIELYDQVADLVAAERCKGELNDARQKHQACAPLPAIDYHAHPIFHDALKQDPPLYMAAKHFRVKPEAFPADLEGMVCHMDEANVEKAVIMSLQDNIWHGLPLRRHGPVVRHLQ